MKFCICSIGENSKKLNKKESTQKIPDKERSFRHRQNRKALFEDCKDDDDIAGYNLVGHQCLRYNYNRKCIYTNYMQMLVSVIIHLTLLNSVLLPSLNKSFSEYISVRQRKIYTTTLTTNTPDRPSPELYSFIYFLLFFFAFQLTSSQFLRYLRKLKTQERTNI